jgi:hypothetical protein
MCLTAVAFTSSPVFADRMVPFKGTWTGETVAADLSGFPVVAVLAEGSGEFTHLGRSTMASPHTTDVFTGETLGDQIFTAANGDMLTAYCAGFAGPDADGIVSGTLDCSFTSGTGLFEGATGRYTFALVATPQVDGPGYDTVAVLEGSISTVGSRR